jgi:hypothetical protein
MKFETLKLLVEKIKLTSLSRDEASIQLQEAIEKAMIEQFIELLDIYEKDNQELEPTDNNIPIVPQPPFDRIGDTRDNGLVPYGTLCSCNPANGGSGICGCVIANKLVDPNITLNSNFTSK